MHISVSNVHVGITPQIFLSVHCAISGFNTCRPASIEFDYLCCLPRTIIVYEIYLGKEPLCNFHYKFVVHLLYVDLVNKTCGRIIRPVKGLSEAVAADMTLGNALLHTMELLLSAFSCEHCIIDKISSFSPSI